MGRSLLWAGTLHPAETPPSSRLQMSFDAGKRFRWIENQRGGCGVDKQEGLRFTGHSFSLVRGREELNSDQSKLFNSSERWSMDASLTGSQVAAISRLNDSR